MSENVLKTVQTVVQDVIAPDVRELKVRTQTLEQLVAELRKYIDVRFDLLDQKNDAQFQALLSAISEARTQAELTSIRVISNISERVAVLEAQRHQ